MEPELPVTRVSRSGRICKKSSFLTDFESPDEIDTRYKRHSKKTQPKVATGNANGQIQKPKTSEWYGPVEEFTCNGLSSSSVIENPACNGTSELATGSSVYVKEKSKKKAPDAPKTVRKDKGISRFTAYMLWSKEMRREIMSNHPEFDFSEISKRLGELWATVPSTEKHNWKRRARRLSATGNATKVANSNNENKETLPDGSSSTNIDPLSKDDSEASRPKGIAMIDSAAHLQLLGESLSIIGSRLKEHEGQIIVSGTISVLTDSILCALAPLLCVINDVPEFRACSDEQLLKLMDDIAYIMPGL